MLIYIFFLGVAVVAKGLATVSYCKPSCCGCCLGIHLLYFVVMVVECLCSKCIYFHSVGSNSCCFGSCWIRLDFLVYVVHFSLGDEKKFLR